MKKRIKEIAWKTASVSIACALLATAKAEAVFGAYNFAMTGASQEGTVIVEAVAGATRVNGYGRPESYRVVYSVSRDSWQAFDDRYGGYFLVGNEMDARGGCQFAYHTSGGEIWEDGAIALGRLKDGRVIGQGGAQSGTVSSSFQVGSLEELPAYVAYAYEPASGAYLHISEEYGANSHVWCYQTLKNVPVQFGEEIDRDAPALTVSVLPQGNRVEVKGKVWATAATIELRAQDDKAGPGGIRVYRSGTQLKEFVNPGNERVLQGSYQAADNGNYEADSYDRLNNVCNKISVTISCIDREAPVIEKLYPEDTGFVKSTRIIADAKDNGCGLNEKAYSWNGGAWTSENRWEINENGVYTLKVRDALGNESTKTVTVSNIDREAPEISMKITPKGKMTTYQGVLWSTEAELSADAADPKSGVREISATDSSGRVLGQVQSPLETGVETLKLEGLKIKNGSYKIKAVDMLGNSGTTEEKTIAHIDGEAPLIKNIGQVEKEDGTVLLTVEAEDKGIGLGDLPYSIDGGKTWQKEPSFVVEEEGDYEICVRDRLEQTAEDHVRVEEIKDQSQSSADDDDDGQKEPDQSRDGGGNESDNDEPEKTDQGAQIPDVVPLPGTNGGIKEKLSRAKKELKELHDSIPEKSGKSDQPAVKSTVVEQEPDFTEPKEEEIDEIVSSETGKERANAAPKAVFIALGAVFAAGCLGLLLYLLLFYLRYSCVCYGIDEEWKKCRLCRLPLKETGDGWYLEVPDRKLGTCGTGNYLLVFHPSFAKEEEGTYVVVDIDGKSLREKTAREIRISI